ncbi:adenylate synthase [Cytophagales bacterium LB-30]|uniref:Adenylate synthase n=1 Tax=Shiella aurantiaca TaxID=3058365 RepID=A0ABT8F432_9BACT|nr:F390 synthetase-related protein [Shiella aurantiaca]MDN4165143.1 adenylate synthase [Shiella aurantiaca]
MRFKLHILYYLVLAYLSRAVRKRPWALAWLKAYRWKRLQKALIKSPLYAPYAQKTLAEFPLSNKSFFMQHFDTINTLGIRKEEALQVALRSEESRDFNSLIGSTTVGLSSGTSGNKGVFLVTPRERAIWVASILERAIGFSLQKRKVAFFLRANSKLYQSVDSSLLEFHFFDILKDSESLFQQCISLQPHILVAPPSVLWELKKYCKKHNQSLHPQKIISVAEVLEKDQAIAMQQFFGQPIHQVYQCTEGFLAHTCSHGKLHLNEDWLIIERHYLDAEKSRFHPIVTDLLRWGQPIIRYELNDILHEGAACTCGLKTTVIDTIEGRSDDVFTFATDQGEVIIYPDFFRRAIIKAHDAIENYVVKLINSSTLSVYIEAPTLAQPSEAFGAVQNALKNLLQQKGIPSVDIIWSKEIGLLPGQKFKRIINVSR